MEAVAASPTRETRHDAPARCRPSEARATSSGIRTIRTSAIAAGALGHIERAAAIFARRSRRPPDQRALPAHPRRRPQQHGGRADARSKRPTEAVARQRDGAGRVRGAGRGRSVECGGEERRRDQPVEDRRDARSRRAARRGAARVSSARSPFTSSWRRSIRRTTSLRMEVASDYNRLATLQTKQGDRAAALENHTFAVTMTRGLTETAGSNIEYHVALALALTGRGDAYARFGRAPRSTDPRRRSRPCRARLRRRRRDPRRSATERRHSGDRRQDPRSRPRRARPDRT